MSTRRSVPSRQSVPADARASSACLPAVQHRLRPPTRSFEGGERTSLLSSLEAARSFRLSILLAPCGYGKTSLLCDWHKALRAANVPVAWYTASCHDRAPGVVLRMLCAALNEAGVAFDPTSPFHDVDPQPQVLLGALLARLHRLEQPTVLVLDDFDCIDSPDTAPILEALIEALPQGVHMVIAARRKPSLSIARLRTQGAIRIIDGTELRLRREEIGSALGLPPHSPDSARIAEQTGGWPAAVKLYRLWRERIGDDDVLRFSGHVEEVADYLTEQVFSTLPRECREFLIDVSAFDEVGAEFADHVRGRRDSAELLKRLQHELSVLVQSSDRAGELTYNFHPLLADFAYQSLQRQLDRETALHLRAADWLWQNQRFAAAFHHLNRARAPDVIRERLRSLDFLRVFLAFGAGEMQAIFREIEPVVPSDDPRRQLIGILAHFKAGFFGESMDWLARARRAIELRGAVAEPDRLLLDCAALAVLFHMHVHGPDDSCFARERDLRAKAQGQPLLWAWCEGLSIVLHEMRGDFSAARHSLARSEKIFNSMFMLSYAEDCLFSHKVLIPLAQGQLRAAAQLSGAALRVHARPQVDRPTISGFAKLAHAAIEYQRHYTENVADMTRSALDHIGEGRSWLEPFALAWPILCDVAWRTSGLGAVLNVTRQIRSRMQERRIPCADGIIIALETIYAARAGDLERARRGCEVLQGRVVNAWRERDLIAQALILTELRAGDAIVAAERSAQMAADGRTNGRLGTEIKGCILEALALEQAKDSGRAATRVREAVSLAFAEGIIAPFAEEGAALQALLERLAAAGGTDWEINHTQAILRVIGTRHRHAAPDGLSEREADVMVQLAHGAPNKIIARRLGLSENTVKFHLRNIYAKLRVDSRKAAVAALRDRA